MHHKQISEMTLEEKRIFAKTLLNAKGSSSGQSNNGSGNSSTEMHRRFYDFELFPEYIALQQQRDRMQSLNIRNPYFDCHSDVSNSTVQIENRTYINFSGYNYLGFAGHPEINQFVQKAVEQYGTSVSASRIVSGQINLHEELEREISELIGTQDCVVSVSGYGTNTATISHLLRPQDIIFHDELSHNSIIMGCKLSGARRIAFPHNDVAALNKLIEQNRNQYERALIVIEGLYSMDGDIPDLPQYIQIKKKHKLFLMVDEAHSMGVLGPNGFGIREYYDVDPDDVDIWMGTLSKSLASCGGYICGRSALIDILRNNAAGCIMYSAGITPPNTAAALAAVKKLKREPGHVHRLHENAELFLTLARARGFNTGFSQHSPIIPIILRKSIFCLQMAQYLFEKGINVHPILYPAVPENDARLRFFITASHSPDQIRFSVDTLAEAFLTCSQQRGPKS